MHLVRPCLATGAYSCWESGHYGKHSQILGPDIVAAERGVQACWARAVLDPPRQFAKIRTRASSPIGTSNPVLGRPLRDLIETKPTDDARPSTSPDGFASSEGQHETCLEPSLPRVIGLDFLAVPNRATVTVTPEAWRVAHRCVSNLHPPAHRTDPFARHGAQEQRSCTQADRKKPPPIGVDVNPPKQ